jgi:hypothetical protein
MLPEVARLESWLAANDNWEELLKVKNIDVRRDPEHPQLTTLNYNLHSDRKCALTSSCRGTVIDSLSRKVVSYSFTRFFNIHEFNNLAPIMPELKFDWASAQLQEKLDGTLTTLYYYLDEWHVATTGSPRASGPVNLKSDKTFREHFWEVYNQKRYPYPDTRYIYVFELCSKENKVVLNYPEPTLKLLTVRQSHSYEEVHNWEYLYHLQAYETPRKYFSKDFTAEDVTRLCSALNKGGELEHEGYVVVDAQKNRLKAKTIDYLQAHRYISNQEPNFIELYLSDSLNEFVSYFPEFTGRVNEFLQKIDSYREVVNGILLDPKISKMTSRERYEYLEQYGSKVQYIATEILKGYEDQDTFDKYIRTRRVHQLKKLLSDSN